MRAEVNKSAPDEKHPFIEIRFQWDEEDEQDWEFTFRSYYENVFVAVEDNRDNPFSGADLEDCWLAPAVLIQKVRKFLFNPKDAFELAMCYGGYISGRKERRTYEALLFEKWWKEVDPQVRRWQELCSNRDFPVMLDIERDDHWYHDNPNY